MAFGIQNNEDLPVKAGGIMFESVSYYIAGAADKQIEQFINTINDIRIKMMIRFCKRRYYIFVITSHCINI